ncbi:MAG: hypothetical protein QXJ03_00280 [Desulfurococcus sp.]
MRAGSVSTRLLRRLKEARFYKPRIVGLQTIGDIVSDALYALNGGGRSMQEYYKMLLDYLNNNNVYIVHSM